MKPGLFFLAAAAAGALSAQVDVLTANYDNNRTNANLNEGILNLNNVNPAQFGLLYKFPVDGQVYAQPLYVHALAMPQGTLNVLYVATMHNTVFAFDADAVNGTAPLWQVNLGPSIPPAALNSDGQTFTDILHEVGILSTPVIDRTGNTIYAVAQTTVNGDIAFFLHALDLTTGAEKLNGPMRIQATVAGTGWGGTGDATNGQLPFNPAQHLQRPGLLLVNNAIYIGFGSHGDFVPWHGWLFAYNSIDLPQQIAVFNTTPSAAGSSIWQGGRGLAADSDGGIYCATGNGNYDGVMSWGETVLHLTPALEVADWFTPAEFTAWTDDDLDLGSNGPILIPGTNFIVAGGKAGSVALLDRTNMGHEGADTNALQFFTAVPDSPYAIFNTAIWNRPGGPMLYIWGSDSVLRQFQMQSGLFNTTPVEANSSVSTSGPFGGLSVSSNPFVPESGIFWATSFDKGSWPRTGALHAFDAGNVNTELWNSNMQQSRDALGNATKFANPTVVNGKVYVPTDSNQVMVYGLLPVPGVQTVLSAAGFVSSAVSPGELIAIFGNSIGPPTPVGLALDPSGKVSTSAGGVTVTFDGNPAPLLYASTGQINAIVPFEVDGQSATTMQVSAPGGSNYTVTLPVALAAPAVFTIGGGQGAVLNSDLSVNSAANPAARGSWISIYATGTGILNTAVADGAIISGANLPQSAHVISVTIGGQPATVNYQGAAPGLVAGVMQINALVPSGVTPGSAVPLTIAAGSTSGLNTVTVAIK